MALKDDVLAAVGAAWDELAARDPQALTGLDADHAAREIVLSSIGPVLSRTIQQRMTDDLGPYYDVDGLARRWGVTRQAVSKRHTRGELLGLRTQDGRILLPTWQFHPGTDLYPQVIDGICSVRQVLGQHNPDPLSQAIWLTAATFGPEELPAYEVLQRADGIFIVMSAARGDVQRLTHAGAAEQQTSAHQSPVRPVERPGQPPTDHQPDDPSPGPNGRPDQ